MSRDVEKLIASGQYVRGFICGECDLLTCSYADKFSKNVMACKHYASKEYVHSGLHEDVVLATNYTLKTLIHFEPEVYKVSLHSSYLKFGFLPIEKEHKIRISSVISTDRKMCKWNLNVVKYKDFSDVNIYCRYYATKEGLCDSFTAYYMSIINSDKQIREAKRKALGNFEKIMDLDSFSSNQ